jgi:RNA polymerase sigma-70 factor (ECF subfamily)
MPDRPLHRALVAALDPALARLLPPAEEVERALAAHLAAGRTAVPAAALTDADFVAHLARVLDPEKARIDALFGADLFLAAALARRDPAALAAFERAWIPELRGALDRLRLPADAAAEALQAFRVELLIGERPHIGSYAGRGDLRSWLRVGATRLAVRTAARGERERALDEALLDTLTDPAAGAAEAGQKAELREALKRAVKQALGELSPRARTLLRQSLLDGLSIDELAGLHGAHRATCARWLADARDLVIKRSRRALLDDLRLRTADLDSVMRALGSHLDVSLARLLRTGEPTS